MLHTSELLETILSALSVGDILTRVQRVCKDWKATIDQSPTIRTKLWFKAQASRVISPDGSSADQLLPIGAPTKVTMSYFLHLEQNMPLYNGQIARNPLFRPYRRRGAIFSFRMPIRGRIQGPVAGAPTYHHFTIDQVEQVNAAHTWLDMYLTEPRVTTAQLIISLPPRGKMPFFHEIARSTVYAAHGLTFRSVMSEVNQVFQSGHWRSGPYGRSLRRPGLARVAVALFAGT